MTSIEEKRSDVIPYSDDKCSHCKCHNGVILSNGIKLLLLFLGVSLAFFLGSLSALRMDWSCSSDRQQLMGNCSRIKDYLSTCQKYIRSQSYEPCEDGWTAHDGKCYFFSSKEQTWFDSRLSCEALDAHLVIIDKAKEQEFLSPQIKVSTWIGLNDLDTEGRWVWVNNQTLEETGVQFWHKRMFPPSEPDNWKNEDPSGEDCVCLGVQVPPNIWFDYSCKHELKFICEKKNRPAYSFTEDG